MFPCMSKELTIQGRSVSDYCAAEMHLRNQARHFVGSSLAGRVDQIVDWFMAPVGHKPAEGGTSPQRQRRTRRGQKPVYGVKDSGTKLNKVAPTITESVARQNFMDSTEVREGLYPFINAIEERALRMLQA